MLAPADLPYDQYTPLVTAWATMRTWDLCAIHDPAEARGMLSGTAGSVAPQLDLSGCTVTVRADDTTWSFTLDLATTAHLNETPTPIMVASTRLQRYVDQPRGDCEFDLPYRDGGVAALALTVDTLGDISTSRACQVGENYLRTIITSMNNPPRAGTGASTPPLRLAGQDPCAGLAAIRGDMETNGRGALLMSVFDPAECGAEAIPPDYHGTADSASYQLRFAVTYPSELQQGHPLTIGGMRAVSQQKSSCTTLVDIGANPIVVSNDGEQYLQTIELSTPRCGQHELMQRMIAPYAAALRAAPAPPQRDAVHLGDLDPPSTPTDVGAPFDPCTIVSWTDFPRTAHIQGDPSPYLAALNRKDIVQTGCVFHGTKAVTTLGWARDTLQTLQQRNLVGGRPITIAGRSAAIATTTKNGKHYCTHFVSAQQGTIAITTSNNYSTISPCPVNTALLKVILATVP